MGLSVRPFVCPSESEAFCFDLSTQTVEFELMCMQHHVNRQDQLSSHCDITK